MGERGNVCMSGFLHQGVVVHITIVQ